MGIFLQKHYIGLLGKIGPYLYNLLAYESKNVSVIKEQKRLRQIKNLFELN